MRILLIVAPRDGDSVPVTLEHVVEPYYRFVDHGMEVVVASPDGGSPVAVLGTGQSELVKRLRTDHVARDV